VVKIVEVEELDETKRGAGGFGIRDRSRESEKVPREEEGMILQWWTGVYRDRGTIVAVANIADGPRLSAEPAVTTTPTTRRRRRRVGDEGDRGEVIEERVKVESRE